MHVSKALRRLAVVAATSSILGAVPFAAPAFAGGVRNLSSPAETNTGSFQVAFDTDSTFSNVAKPTVTFSRDAAPSETIQGSTVTVSGSRVTVTVDLTRKNPGPYDIEVKGATSSPPAQDTVDTCDKCFTVLAFAPTVTAPTPTAPVTLGAGTSGVLFVVNGTNFTDAQYCTSGPCTNQPKLAVSPPADVTFTGSGTNGAVEAATDQIKNRISIAPTAQPGPRDIVVTNTDNKSAVCQGCLVVNAGPTLTKAEPAALGVGVQDATLVLTGTNFAPGVQVAITRVGSTTSGVTADPPVRNSATQISIPNVDIDANAVADVRRITVTNPDSGQVVSDTLFRINNRPTVSGALTYSDNAAGVERYGRGALNRTLVVNGSNFQPGATVAFANGTGITQNGTPTYSADGTKITLNVTLDQARSATAPAIGNHQVTVTNPDRGTNTGTAVNFVVAVGPKLTEVTPPSRGRGQEFTQVTLKGENFPTVTADARVEIDGVSNIVVTSASSDGTSLVISGVTSNALNVAGLKNVTVTNLADKGRDVCVGCFAIDNLQTDSMSPSTVLNDATQDVTVSGSGFAPDAVATFVKTGAGAGEVPNIVGTTKSVDIEGKSLTAAFPFAGVAPGQWTLRVTNPTNNAGVGTCTCTLNVVAPTPTISGLSRSTVGQGADDFTIEINGTGFAPGAAVEFTNTGVTVVSRTVTPTKITAVIDVAPNATIDSTAPSADGDTTKVTVRNTDGRSANTDFDVVAGPKPSASDIASRAQGTVTTIKVTGDDFADGATLVFSGTGVTAGATSFTNGVALPQEKKDELASQVTVAGDAPTGARTITVVNPDGGRGSCACFTVNAKPVVDSVTPAKGARGSSPVVTITGSGFTAGSSVTVSGAHVSPTVTATTPTSLTVTLAVGNEALVGSRDITVTNADGGVGTKAAAFKVFTVPGAPTGVTGQRGEGKATVSWTAPIDNGNDPLTEYVVTTLPGSAQKTVPANETSTTIENLTNGTAYKFTVVARNAAGSGPASAESAPVTPATKPNAPLNVTATPGEGDAVVSWTAPAFDGGSPLTGYTVTSNPGGIKKTVTGTTATVPGLANGTEYTFTVVATNDVGDSAASAASTAVTPFTEPDAPTGVKGTPADGAVNVQWTAPAFDGGRPISGYTITVSPGGVTKNVPSSMTSAMVDGLTNGTPYTFTVFATNERGAGPASAASDAVTPFTKPGAPTSVQATPADGQVTVTWAAPEDNGGNALTGYVVTLSPGNVVKEVGADTLNAVVTGLANGTEYTATVGATNAAGTTTSEPSAPVTPRTVPGAPTAVQAVRGDQSATVSWTAPESNGGSPITGYTVTVTPGGTTKQVGADATSTVVSGLTNGTAYTFSVLATNVAGDGASAASNAVTPAGVPTAPSTVVASGGTNGTASVSWTEAGSNGSPVTGYTVTASPGGATKTVGAASRSTAFSGLTDGTPYTFTVKAINAVGTGAGRTSDAVTPRASTGLSLSATSQIVSGGTATLRGVLNKLDGTRVVGQQVRVYAKPAGASSFTLVRYLTTGADGSYSTTFKPTRNTTYVTTFAGTAGLMPSRSAERVTKVAYKITAAYSLSGRTLTVSGAVSPNAPGRLIYLRQRKADGSLVTIGQGYVQSNGTYRIVRTLAAGTYNTFVHLPATSANLAGNTPLRSVTIR